MKKILLSAFLLLNSISIWAQVIAGTIPAGFTTVNPNANITIQNAGTEDSLSLDLDGDGNFDLKVHLYCGYTAIDVPNGLSFEILNSSVQICSGKYFPSMPEHATYHSLGDTLNCQGTDTSWHYSPNIDVCSYGTFITYGYATASNIYFAFKKNAQVGWFKASLNINDNGQPTVTPIFFNVHEILIPISLNALNFDNLNQSFKLYPNPAQSGEINIEIPLEFSNGTLAIHNSIGQLINSLTIKENSFSLDISNYPKGVYFFTLKTKDKTIASPLVIKE